jgi:hypothetical protein
VTSLAAFGVLGVDRSLEESAHVVARPWRVLEEFMTKLEIVEGQPFSTKPGRYWTDHGPRYAPRTWLRRKDQRGRDVGLNICHIVDHILAQPTVGVVRTGQTKIAAIDLDAHTSKTKATLFTRLAQVRAALNDAPCVLMQSPRGLHVYYFLKVAVDAAKLRRSVVAALERGGVKVAPGLVEVFPNGGQLLRLPLGRRSHQLHDRTLKVLAVKEGCKRVRRDWGLALRLFLKLVDRRRVELAQLVGRELAETALAGVGVQQEGWSPNSHNTTHRPATSTNLTTRQDYQSRVAQALPGAALGQRYEQSRLLLFHWYITPARSRSSEEGVRLPDHAQGSRAAWPGRI